MKLIKSLFQTSPSPTFSLILVILTLCGLGHLANGNLYTFLGFVLPAFFGFLLQQLFDPRKPPTPQPLKTPSYSEVECTQPSRSSNILPTRYSRHATRQQKLLVTLKDLLRLDGDHKLDELETEEAQQEQTTRDCQVN